MSNKKLTLTIVIPVYNEQDHLGACLEAIARQTVKPDQVIVVDNNSTDKTVEIALRYPFVTIIKEKHQGVLFARNAGFDRAKGDIIGRIDGDTVLRPDWVARVKDLYSAAGAPRYFVATAPGSFLNKGPRILFYIVHRLTYFWFAQLLLGHRTLYGSNMFLTNALWQDVKNGVCLQTRMHEDMDLAYHVHQAGARIHFVPTLKSQVWARKMLRRSLLYPLMMVRTRRGVHGTTLASS